MIRRYNRLLLLSVIAVLVSLGSCRDLTDDTIDGEEDTGGKKPTYESDPYSTKVFEFLPAPGQFVNKNYDANSMEEANKYAEGRLKNNQYVSLGGFGGYIVVGFDHSIKNSGSWDFAIYGNSFEGSSEPGIVWVMQDTNKNGLPDDTWYELKGSETGKSGTIQNYEVTYFKPTEPKSPVKWIDNLGNEGEIKWLNINSQDYYYPNWVKEDSYTLKGTRLESRSEDMSDDDNSHWVNKDFEWGYADNFSSVDRLTSDDNKSAGGNANHFKISNAIDSNGKSIHLNHIDFIKVQTAINANAGMLGEISTEVSQFVDIQLLNKN
ncbi:MAG: hypothetical protein ACOYEA_08185 [Fermentimonas sp.]